MKIYNKLVRDKIPKIINKNGKVAVVRTLNDKEYVNALIKKLKEETTEFETDKSIEELADMQEVLIALIKFVASAEEVEKVRIQKARSKGTFENRVYLEKVDG
jgi:predicted house-cleaning noncanonical NTP pyrophosphatase (MazG superfamily)